MPPEKSQNHVEGSCATAQVGEINSELRLRVAPGPPCLEILTFQEYVPEVLKYYYTVKLVVVYFWQDGYMANCF